MKSIILTALGLLFSIASYSQKREATISGHPNKAFFYEVVKETEPIGEGKVNYNTNYCFMNDNGILLFEFRVIHHSWLNEVSFFYMWRDTDNNGSNSVCDPSVGMDLVYLDKTTLSSPAIGENGNMYLRKDGLTGQVKWNSKDHTFIDLVEYTHRLKNGEAVSYAFK